MNTSSKYNLESCLILFLILLHFSGSSQDFGKSQIICSKVGETHSLAIDSKGHLWAWGDNSHGQLGLGVDESFAIPTLVTSANDFVQVDVGLSHSLALDKDGNLFVWGENVFGQLGDGTDKNKWIPQQLFLNKSFLKVEANCRRSAAIDLDGKLWCWGENQNGFIGNGTTEPIVRNPIQVLSEVEIKEVSLGLMHTMVLDADGNIWCWGYNAYGELGNGSKIDEKMPCKLDVEKKFKTISSGSFYSMAIDEEGFLWGWGDNNHGQIHGDLPNKILNPIRIHENIHFKKIKCGTDYTIGIDEYDRLFAWGNNTFGQLGTGLFHSEVQPVHICQDFKFKSIDASTYGTSQAVDYSGRLWTWGNNMNGKLGCGNMSIQPVPMKISSDNYFNWFALDSYGSIGIDSDGYLFATGNIRTSMGFVQDTLAINKKEYSRLNTEIQFISVVNNSGIIAGIDINANLWLLNNFPNNTYYMNYPIQMFPETEFQKIVADYRILVALDSSGGIWCMGDNQYGQLGNGSFKNEDSLIAIVPELKFKDIAVTFSTTLALDENGDVWAWGNNSVGQFGNGTTVSSNFPVKTITDKNFEVISGNIAIDRDGRLWGWGWNEYGSLGDGTKTNRLSPIPILEEHRFKSVASAGNYSIAIDIYGCLWAWGFNEFGQLGDGQFGQFSPGRPIFSTTPERIESSVQFKSVFVGNMHVMAIDEDGSLWGWGYRASGALGDGNAWCETPICLSEYNTSSNLQISEQSNIHAFGAIGSVVIHSSIYSKYRMYNTMGNLLKKGILQSNKSVIDNLNSGIYILVVEGRSFKLVVR